MRHMRHEAHEALRDQNKQRESHVRREAHGALVATHFFWVAYKFFENENTT